MCCCAKPNVNGELGYSWDGKAVGVHPVAAPALIDGETVLFDEPGRCGGLDCHSHHYRLVKGFAATRLLVRHGGGDERIMLSLPRGFSFDAMDSNTRYWLFSAIYHAYADGERESRDATARKYSTAFAEGRLKKRKARGSCKVWIEAKAG